jgi:F-type H+-transporting ATPase subunit epsilon
MSERIFPLEVVTPTQQVYEGGVRSLQAPGVDGDFEVLIGHIPMITALKTGVITIRDASGRNIYAVSGGFVEVLRHQATVLAEAVERVEDIDIDRARQAEIRARERLDSGKSDVDIIRAQSALGRALNRIKASGIAAR